MYRWYVVNTYSGHEKKVKQNLEHRVVSLGQTARRAPGRRPDRDRLRDEGRPEGHRREADDARLRAREHGPQRGLLALVKGTPGVTGFVGASNEPVPLTQPEVDRLLHREVAQKVATQGAVLDRRVRQGRLRPAVGLLRRDLRDQPGRREAQGARLDLRSRDAGRGRLRPGQEDLDARPRLPQVTWRRRSSPRSSCRPPAARRQPGAAGRPRAGPARHQHHGVLQGVQRPDPAGQPARRSRS